MLEQSLFNWALGFLSQESMGGFGAASAVKVTPGIMMRIAAGCNTSPCFICNLRNVIGNSLRQDLRLAEELKRIKEKKKKQENANYFGKHRKFIRHIRRPIALEYYRIA